MVLHIITQKAFIGELNSSITLINCVSWTTEIVLVERWFWYISHYIDFHISGTHFPIILIRAQREELERCGRSTAFLKYDLRFVLDLHCLPEIQTLANNLAFLGCLPNRLSEKSSKPKNLPIFMYQHVIQLFYCRVKVTQEEDRNSCRSRGKKYEVFECWC